VNEVLNLAMLTGNKQVYPLWIYKVSDVGMVAEVTSTTACHSVENDIMKVCLILIYECKQTVFDSYLCIIFSNLALAYNS
jgi:hypothetical protein